MNNLSYKDNPEAEKHVIDTLAKNTNLSKWDKKFIKNVKKYNDGCGFLSDPQKKVLSVMWEKY